MGLVLQHMTKYKWQSLFLKSGSKTGARGQKERLEQDFFFLLTVRMQFERCDMPKYLLTLLQSQQGELKVYTLSIKIV